MKNKKKTYCFDLDNTLCKTVNGDYKNSKPLAKPINTVNSLYDEGNKIIIFTARFMGKMKGNLEKVNKMGFKLTSEQLDNWGVKYHELILGKPEYDVIIDDKSIFFKKNWFKSFSKISNKTSS